MYAARTLYPAESSMKGLQLCMVHRTRVYECYDATVHGAKPVKVGRGQLAARRACDHEETRAHGEHIIVLLDQAADQNIYSSYMHTADPPVKPRVPRSGRSSSYLRHFAEHAITTTGHQPQRSNHLKLMHLHSNQTSLTPQELHCIEYHREPVCLIS